MRKIIAAFAFAAIASGASAQTVVVDITGVESRDGQGNPINVVLGVDLGVPNAEVTGIAWDLLFTPNAPSWTSEPHMTYGDTGGSNAYDWDMGNWGGVDNSTPITLLGSDTTSFFVGGDGILRIEFWEDFVDFAGAADGGYGSGSSLTISFAVLGACCLPNGTCVDGETVFSCNSLGGAYQGNGSQCGPLLCLTGACCLPPSTCVDGETASSCVLLGGAYQGDGSQCAALPDHGGDGRIAVAE